MTHIESKATYETMTVPFNEELAWKLEDRFRVGISQTNDKRMIKVIGDLHLEAAREYTRLIALNSSFSV